MNAMQTLHTSSEISKRSPDVLINPELSDFTWVEYYRSEELIQRGIAAAEQALPAIKRALLAKVAPWQKRSASHRSGKSHRGSQEEDVKVVPQEDETPEGAVPISTALPAKEAVAAARVIPLTSAGCKLAFPSTTVSAAFTRLIASSGTLFGSRKSSTQHHQVAELARFDRPHLVLLVRVTTRLRRVKTQRLHAGQLLACIDQLTRRVFPVTM